MDFPLPKIDEFFSCIYFIAIFAKLFSVKKQSVNIWVSWLFFLRFYHFKVKEKCSRFFDFETALCQYTGMTKFNSVYKQQDKLANLDLVLNTQNPIMQSVLKGRYLRFNLYNLLYENISVMKINNRLLLKIL